MDKMNVFHLNAEPGDFVPGCVVLLPGSDGRARQIASRLQNVREKTSERQLNCFFGQFGNASALPSCPIAVVSTGMGCPSMDIVLSELLNLGAKNFIRLGTAGSLQPGRVQFGDLVIVQGAVRDESTSRCYAPVELPAVAHWEVVDALRLSTARLPEQKTHLGLVHCKDSLFAREFGTGPLAPENKRYMEVLSQCGVLASEMETAQLLVRGQVESPLGGIRAGALLAVIGGDEPFESKDKGTVIENLIIAGLDAAAQLVRPTVSLRSEINQST